MSSLKENFYSVLGEKVICFCVIRSFVLSFEGINYCLLLLILISIFFIFFYEMW